MKHLNLAILITGRGSNMEALLASAKADSTFPGRPVVVISSNKQAQGIEKAMLYGVPVEIVDRGDYSSKQEFEKSLLMALGRYQVDVICLAGFMHVLSDDFISSCPQKIINIHPSLLPAYKGLDTHARVLAAGEKETGCTVHYVIPELDSGDVIIQQSVPVQEGDTQDSLAARVLTQEHIIYPEAVRMLAQGGGAAK